MPFPSDSPIRLRCPILRSRSGRLELLESLSLAAPCHAGGEGRQSQREGRQVQGVSASAFICFCLAPQGKGETGSALSMNPCTGFTARDSTALVLGLVSWCRASLLLFAYE